MADQMSKLSLESSVKMSVGYLVEHVFACYQLV